MVMLVGSCRGCGSSQGVVISRLLPTVGSYPGFYGVEVALFLIPKSGLDFYNTWCFSSDFLFVGLKKKNIQFFQTRHK